LDSSEKDNISEELSEDIIDKIFSQHINTVNTEFDTHTSLLDSMFDKVSTDLATIKDTSLKYCMEESDAIVQEFESMKKEYEEDPEGTWMTRQEHNKELVGLVQQNEELRQLAQKRGLIVFQNNVHDFLPGASESDGDGEDQ